MQWHIFIVTNWLSHSLLFTAIAITSLLCYWYIVANFCKILGTHHVQTFIWKWGDMVTQYMTVLVDHSSLIQQTHEKVVSCNSRSVSEIVNIWWLEEQSYSFTYIWECLTEISWLLSIFIWVLVIYSWFNKYVKLKLYLIFKLIQNMFMEWFR